MARSVWIRQFRSRQVGLRGLGNFGTWKKAAGLAGWSRLDKGKKHWTASGGARREWGRAVGGVIGRREGASRTESPLLQQHPGKKRLVCVSCWVVLLSSKFDILCSTLPCLGRRRRRTSYCACFTGSRTDHYPASPAHQEADHLTHSPRLELELELDLDLALEMHHRCRCASTCHGPARSPVPVLVL